MITFPKLVFLRDGSAATINGMIRTGEADQSLMIHGDHTRDGSFDLWLPTGRWSYRPCDHPLDIVSLVVSEGKKVEFNQAVLA